VRWLAAIIRHNFMLTLALVDGALFRNLYEWRLYCTAAQLTWSFSLMPRAFSCRVVRYAQLRLTVRLAGAIWQIFATSRHVANKL